MASWELTTAKILEVLRLNSVKSRIGAFAVLATLVPSLSTALISYRQSRASLTEKISNELRNASANAARGVEDWIEEQSINLRVFATSYVITENLARRSTLGPSAQSSLEGVTQLTDYMAGVGRRFELYDHLSVLDRGGAVVATSTGEQLDLRLDPDWLSLLRTFPSTYGDPYWDAASGRWTVDIAVAVATPDATFLGVLAARLNLQAIQDTLNAYAVGQTARLYLADSTGTSVPQTGLAANTPHQIPPSIFAQLTSAQGGLVDFGTTSGEDVVGSLTPVVSHHWSVIAQIARAEAFVEIARLRNITVVILISVLAAVGALAYALALLIVRPLDRLTQGAAEVASGDLAVDIPVYEAGEVGYLTQVFNDMVARLRASRETLDTFNDELQAKNQELERLSITDGLTGLHNRRHLMASLQLELKRSERGDGKFSFLILDVDHFKKFNDTYGHQAGDRALVVVAEVLNDITRDIDCVARYGGEEFVLLLPDTAIAHAQEVAQRIRTRLKDAPIEVGNETATVTVSIGVSEFPTNGATADEVISAADQALYKAKRAGRDQIVMASGKRPSARNAAPRESRRRA